MNTEAIVIKSPEALAARERIDDFINQWHVYLASEKSAETLNVYRKGMKLFTDYLDRNAIEFSEVKPSIIRGWRDELSGEGKARATINIWLTALRRFYSYVVTEHDIAIVNPAVGIKARGQSSEDIKRGELSSKDILRLQEICQNEGSEIGARDWAILGLMAYTGIRCNEARLADMKDFETRGGGEQSLNVLMVQGKGYTGKDSFVIISDKADEALRPWLAIRGNAPGALFQSMRGSIDDDGRLSNRSYRKMWEKRKKQAGIVGNNLSIHSLRHSAIANAIRHGADITRVQKMARHKSIETTMRFYAHVDRLENPAEFSISYENGV